MRRMQGWIALLAMLAITPLRASDSCPDTSERFGDARKIVADLGRMQMQLREELADAEAELLELYDA